MADEYIPKSFDGGAQTTTLSSGFTSGGATLSVTNGTSFPDGSSGPFVIVIDRGLASEEKFLIDTKAGSTPATFTIQQAGYDGTSAVSHNIGATVEHCLDAYTIEQANRYVNLQTTKGSLVTHTGSTTVAMAASGTNNLTLLTDSTVSNGIKWGQIVEGTIADGSVSLAKLASALQKLLVPAGTIAATVSATESTGWKFMGQTLTNAEALYPLLFAAAPAGWRTGTEPNRNLVLPPMTDRTLLQAGTTALGAQGGSNTTTIGAANLPAHFHDINHNHGAENFSETAPGHRHSPASPYEYFVVQDQLSGDQYGVSTSLQGGGLQGNNVSVTGYHQVTIAIDLAPLGATSSTGTYTTTDRGTAVANTAMTTTNAHLAINYQIKAH
jgi:microcystin-dependent protein